MNKKLKFGKAFVRNGMPCIEIMHRAKTWKGSGTKETKSYLYCFRNYCFQVCGTIDGEWDKGSTPVFGLDTFGSILQCGPSNMDTKNTQKYIISCCVFDALNNFVNSSYTVSSLPENLTCRYNCPESFNIFINAVYDKYVAKMTLSDGPLQVDDEEEAV